MRGIKRTLQEFKNEAIIVHGERYDYSKVEYINSKNQVIIICKSHGEFKQLANAHLIGIGCRKCDFIQRTKTTEQFIIEAQEVHGNQFDYSKAIYLGVHKKITIICPKHGEFQQDPANHLKGISCPKCRLSKGEGRIRNFLKSREISFEQQKKFENCRNIKQLSFDFYLPDYNLLIEYDGQQHYEGYSLIFDASIKSDELLKVQKRDQIKNKFCEDNDIPLLRIPYTEINEIENTLKNHLSIQ